MIKSVLILDEFFAMTAKIRTLFLSHIKITNYLTLKHGTFNLRLYYRTGIPAEEELLYNLKIRKLKQRKCKKNGFHSTYSAVIDKLKILEGMYAEQAFETVSISGETYYFIPKHLLP